MRKTRTFIAADLPEEIAGKAERALMGIGALEEATERSVTGTVAYGLRRASLYVTWAEELEGMVVTLQATGDDVDGLAEASALDRFEASYRNLDNPHFQPDRTGVSPVNLLLAIGLFAGAVLLLTGIGVWLLNGAR